MRSRQKPLGLGEEPKKPQPLRHAPFPGMIDGNRWAVREGRWPTFIDRSGDEGVMHVPLGGADVERKLRLHEEAHVAWTPLVSEEQVREWGVEERTIEACEDGRIIDLMGSTNDNWRAVNEGHSVLTPTQISRHRDYFERLYRKLQGEKEEPGPMMQEEPSLVEGARLIASSRGYAEAETFDQLSANMPWIKDAVTDMHRRHIGLQEDPTFENTVAYAQELERFFSEIEEQLVSQSEMMREADMPPHVPQPTEDSDEDYVWGEMEIERVPLPERLRHADSKRVRAVDKGAVPRYMHRLVSDQRVFGRRRKEKHFQGTVLIDHSGSMSLSVDQVDEMLRRWPAVTIASYSGDFDGVLRIIAEKGKRAAHHHLQRPGGGGNCVDGPALDWLCKQRGPRIWISDGAVSGQGEDFRPWFRLDAARKVLRGKIKRIEDVHSLLGS
jgi:hypothetical protein